MQEQPTQPTEQMTPPQPPVPVYQPAQPVGQLPLSAMPGKTMGIVGFVFAFISLQIPGLILSIISYKKAKNAGFKNTLAYAGIILNSVFLGLSVILIPILAGITIVSYNGVTTRANSSASQSAAATVQRNAESYYVDNSAYPTTTAELSVTGVTFVAQPITTQPTTIGSVALYTCGTDGNKIGYWDYTNSIPVYAYTGMANSSSDCTIAQ